MNFTPNLPTQPGFYAWKPDETWVRTHVIQLNHDGVELAPYERNPFTGRFDIPTSGLWCRLVPADELYKAWWEGGIIPWTNSRAKCVAEGLD